ncbi:MAG TPA: HAMP domain-containing protein [Candidatus Excrementavichristensenella intestinipullorum]|nr:HAMP domain-containing protein [Candidatus Excrementavichristensenella intestinipullorum]
MAFTLVATSLIQLVGEYLFSQKVREEQRVTEDLAGSMAQPLSSRDAQALYAQAASVAGQSGGRVMVLDQDGVVQADSLSLANGQRLAIQEVYYVLTGGGSTYGFYDLRRSGSSFLRTLGSGPQANGLLGVYTAPMRQGGQLQGVVLYLSDAQEVYDSLTQMQQRMAIWLLLVAVAVLLLSVMVSRIFTRPIAELSQGIQRMTNGDLSSRVTVRGHNEFSQLAEAFNMMCQRLESLDQSRNQFVSNASHELKTPLSAMKILLETLLYQEAYDPDMTREFLGDINREIDRLNAIVGDLLTLVHIDSGRMQLKPELLKLDELVYDTARRLRPLAEKRDIRLEVTVKDKIETTGDAQKLSQVFYNLMDNAIKYTPEGGFVKAEISRNGRMARVTVADSGIGIPKADLIHVFDRFYRVDKARARATGGTGLGLSIVKQIVMLHEGTINVTSEEEVGSTFTVELPIINLTV